jgi:hypothetical protein
VLWLPVVSPHIVQFWIEYLQGVKDDLAFLVTPHGMPNYHDIAAAASTSDDTFAKVRQMYLEETENMGESKTAIHSTMHPESICLSQTIDHSPLSLMMNSSMC